MDMTTKLIYQPSDLSYYTTWWLTPSPSMSSQATTLSGLDDNDFSIDRHRKKQKMNKNQLKLTWCIPIKIFRLKKTHS